MWRKCVGVIGAALLVACAAVPAPTPSALPATATLIPTATTTVTPDAGPPPPTPSVYPTPTNDPRDPMHAPGTLRTTTWPFGTAAVATFGTGSVDVDIAAVVLTIPVPEGATLAFYVAVPPQRAYAAHVSFPNSPDVSTLQPGDTIRLIGRAAGTYPLPPLEGTGVVINITGQRLVKGDKPLAG